MKDNDGEKDYQYLKSLGLGKIAQYRGEWVAVASEEIVAHGKDPRSVHTEACRAGKGIPFMSYIYAGLSEVPTCYGVRRD